VQTSNRTSDDDQRTQTGVEWKDGFI
jgi:hypothetical protein